MECSICNSRSSIGYCPDCQKLLCEECGVGCAQCGILLCEDHRIRVGEGIYYCKRCVKKSKDAISHGTPVPKHHRTTPVAIEPVESNNHPTQEKNVAPPKGFSFEDLMADMEDDGFEYQVKEKASPEPEADTAGTARDAAAAKPRREPLVSDDPKEFVILASSAPQKTKLWVKTYVISFCALLVILFLWRFPNIGYIQPHTSYLAMFITLNGVFWGGYGLYREYYDNTKKYYLSGIAINFVLTLWAYSLIGR